MQFKSKYNHSQYTHNKCCDYCMKCSQTTPLFILFKMHNTRLIQVSQKKSHAHVPWQQGEYVKRYLSYGMIFIFCLAGASKKRHLSMKDHIYPASLALNEAKCKNGLGEQAHSRVVCEKDVISAKMKCICLWACCEHYIVGTKVCFRSHVWRLIWHIVRQILSQQCLPLVLQVSVSIIWRFRVRVLTTQVKHVVVCMCVCVLICLHRRIMRTHTQLGTWWGPHSVIHYIWG